MPNQHRLPKAGTALALVIFAGLGHFARQPAGPIPPLGLFADPIRGIAGSVRFAELPDSAVAAVPGLAEDTQVLYDDRGVPHIFASTIADAYRALGYVTARDRLFQIELQARAGGGTLTQLAGKRAWQMDKVTHELGMPRAAQRRLAAYDTTTAAWSYALAYRDGINAYVDNLSPKEYPLEYKLLGAHPKRWETVDMMHLLNRMGFTLAYSEDELTWTMAAARIGTEAAAALFPQHTPISQPIQPNGSAFERASDAVIPPPGAPDSAAATIAAILQSVSGLYATVTGSQAFSRADAIGSNNWAVAPSRSSSGHALLAGDPHLELTLPSIWYEVHMVVPDSLDVYGVTIPGAPGVVIGFNRSVAWTFTNTGADVADFYIEQVDNADEPTKYMLDGKYHPIERQVEYGRNLYGKLTGDSVVVYWTHRGPMRKVGNNWVSMRWTVLEATRDFEAFVVASRARSARELLDSMAVHYGAPAQNMLTSDIRGNIAIRSTGKYPLRPGNGRGDRFADGTLRSNDWTGYWDVSEYPQSFNPEQGYLVSANQEPMDPLVQKHYLGANWERAWRAMRINKLLRENSSVTADDMRRYQSDAGSARADWFVPAFLAAAKAVPQNEKATRAAALLSEWDRSYASTNTRTALFEAAMTELPILLWDELRPDSGARGPVPNDDIAAVLLKDPGNAWWDDKRTDALETRDMILTAALERALDNMIARAGEPDAERWQWHNFRVANINHLMGIPSFSRSGVPVQGGPATIWPSTGNGRHGPSWRMVVELDSTPRAWATYPGGQSGNPLSSFYDNRIDQWSRGELDALLTPRSQSVFPLERRGVQLTLRATDATSHASQGGAQ